MLIRFDKTRRLRGAVQRGCGTGVPACRSGAARPPLPASLRPGQPETGCPTTTAGDGCPTARHRLSRMVAKLSINRKSMEVNLRLRLR